jgi:3-oxoadipate enol-lactonase
MVTVPSGKGGFPHTFSVEEQGLVRLVHAALSLRPLVEVLEAPVHVARLTDSQSGTERQAALESLLNLVAARTGSPGFKVLGPGARSSLTVFEQVVSERLFSGRIDPAAAIPVSSAIDSMVDAVIQEDFDRRFNRTEIKSFDEVTLRAYSAGEPRGEAVIIIPACGMPAKLCERWISFLAQRHFVIIWETRGLFGEISSLDTPALDLDAQARDLSAVLGHFGVARGHLMGLCGGAVVAMMAAIEFPQAVSSMSLWYGDFDLGPSSPKTMYQQNLKEVMLMAGAGRSEAAATHELFCGSMVKSAQPDLAHLILYPYATPELFFRYGRLNGSIMSANTAPLLEKIPQPTLIVTSQDDSTAHPAASREVASRLPNAVLHIEDHGDHLSFYDAAPQLTELVSRFLGQ